jgi:hypothetical protein
VVLGPADADDDKVTARRAGVAASLQLKSTHTFWHVQARS